nr:hypothetical protein Iba_chr11bCG0030 [Ipomoea batatas]
MRAKKKQISIVVFESDDCEEDWKPLLVLSRAIENFGEINVLTRLNFCGKMLADLGNHYGSVTPGWLSWGFGASVLWAEANTGMALAMI